MSAKGDEAAMIGIAGTLFVCLAEAWLCFFIWATNYRGTDVSAGFAALSISTVFLTAVFLILLTVVAADRAEVLERGGKDD